MSTVSKARVKNTIDDLLKSVLNDIDSAVMDSLIGVVERFYGRSSRLLYKAALSIQSKYEKELEALVTSTDTGRRIYRRLLSSAKNSRDKEESLALRIAFLSAPLVHLGYLSDDEADEILRATDNIMAAYVLLESAAFMRGAPSFIVVYTGTSFSNTGAVLVRRGDGSGCELVIRSPWIQGVDAGRTRRIDHSIPFPVPVRGADIYACFALRVALAVYSAIIYPDRLLGDAVRSGTYRLSPASMLLRHGKILVVTEHGHVIEAPVNEVRSAPTKWLVNLVEKTYWCTGIVETMVETMYDKYGGMEGMYSVPLTPLHGLVLAYIYMARKHARAEISWLGLGLDAHVVDEYTDLKHDYYRVTATIYDGNGQKYVTVFRNRSSSPAKYVLTVRSQPMSPRNPILLPNGMLLRALLYDDALSGNLVEPGDELYCFMSRLDSMLRHYTVLLTILYSTRKRCGYSAIVKAVPMHVITHVDRLHHNTDIVGVLVAKKQRGADGTTVLSMSREEFMVYAVDPSSARVKALTDGEPVMGRGWRPDTTWVVAVRKKMNTQFSTNSYLCPIGMMFNDDVVRRATLRSTIVNGRTTYYVDIGDDEYAAYFYPAS